MKRRRAHNNKPKHLFKKGHEKLGGRKKGTPNKFTAQVKDLLTGALEEKGNQLARMDPDTYGCGGALAGMLYLMNKEPATFLTVIGKLLPMQLQGSITTDHTHKVYQTVDQLEKAMRDMGLPVPPRMIEINPKAPRVQ